MKKPLLLVFLLCSVSCLLGQESLGDAARKLRANKTGASQPQVKTTTSIDDGPLTDLQLLSWCAAEVRGREIEIEIKNRKLGFEPTEAYLNLLRDAGASASLIVTARGAERLKGAGAETSAETLHAMVSTAQAIHAHMYQYALDQLKLVVAKDPSHV